MSLDPDWRVHAVEVQDIAARITNGDRVFVHGAAATPLPLLDALANRQDLEQVILYHLHLASGCATARPEHRGRFRSVCLFTGPEQRTAVADGQADFIPVFLSQIPVLFKTRRIPLNVALVQLSPPDAHGHCSLGTSVDVARAAVDSADLVLAEINEKMPRTHGNSVVHLNDLDGFVLTDRALPAHDPAPEGEVEQRIGELVADLVEDGATLQMGIGAIPDAVLRRLGNKNDLGIHTEMFSDGVIDLVEGGVITNRYKYSYEDRLATAFVSGSQRLYDFVNDNLNVEFLPADVTNDTVLIRRNPKVTAINSALQIDLSGQVCADSIGHRIYSGIGGQMDFMHGAAKSRGGKPIIALPATAAKGQISRIVMSLTEGAGVVTTRGHVHWVVTEYGAVNLWGATLKERAEALISIAHPDMRADLRKELSGIRHFVFS